MFLLEIRDRIMATYGTVAEFRESEETWTQYVERLEQYFLANDVKDAKIQQAILLSVWGSNIYALVRFTPTEETSRDRAQTDCRRARKTLLTEA